MFRQVEQNQGESDGYSDAVSGKKNHPRPDLTLSIVSSGYRDGYLTAYKKSYYNVKYALAQQQIRKEQDQTKAAKVLASADGGTKNVVFDAGWRDGFIDVPNQQKPTNHATSVRLITGVASLVPAIMILPVPKPYANKENKNRLLIKI